MEQHNGVMIGGTCGAVARAGRLTLLVGDAEEELGPTSRMPADALRLADELAASGDWEFETVAAALQAFVIDHDPPGVAALLEGDEETMVFLFDRAEAIEFHDDEDPETSERVQRGVGRSGWTTELVGGPWIQLRLGLDPVVPWTSLRWGVAIGSSATVPVGTPADSHSTGGQPAALVDTEAVDASPIDAVRPDVDSIDPVDRVEGYEAHPNDAIGTAVAATAPYAASSSHADQEPGPDPDPDEVSTGENPVALDDELDPDPAAEGWDAPPPAPRDAPPEPVTTTPQQSPTSLQHGRTDDDLDDGGQSNHAPADPSATADEIGGQPTIVVDPSQIGLTRIGDGSAHDQPPPPGAAADPAPPGGRGVPPSPPPPRPGQPPVPPPAASPDQPPPPAAAASSAPPPTPAPASAEGNVDLALPPPPQVGQTVAAADASLLTPATTADQRPAPPPGTPPATDQPPAPGSGQPPSSNDGPPLPPTDQPPAPRAESAAEQPPAPPPDTPPPVAPVTAEQPPAPSPGTPPPGTPSAADQPPAPPPGTPPAADQPPAPRTGQPPVPPGLGRTLAPGPADSGSRPEPPPLGAPPSGGQLDPPPPGPQQSPTAVSQGTPPLPPPPSGSPLDTSTPAPPEALAGVPPSPAPPVPGPTPPGPGAEALPPPAGSTPPPPGPGGGARGPEAGPIVGYLIDADDETIVYPIAGPTVIGADPDHDAEVVIGAATPITIDDPSVHDVHVRIKVDGHEVTAEDAGFGESWVQADGRPMKMLTTAGERLLPGCQLRVGGRVLLFRLASAPGS